MCLDFAQAIPEKLPKHGWKVFHKKGKRYISECIANGKIILRGKWLDEKVYRPPKPKRGETLPYAFGRTSRYKKGWHVFRTRSAARSWAGFNTNVCVKKVLMKEIVAYGRQAGKDVFVCKKIKIVD